jgi:hypothetical protein
MNRVVFFVLFVRVCLNEVRGRKANKKVVFTLDK